MLNTIGIKVDTSALEVVDGKMKKIEDLLAGLATSGSDKALGSHRKKVQLNFKFRANATRKMRNVILAVAQQITHYLNSYTIVGDEGKLKQGSSGFDRRYFDMYARRYNKYGIPIEVGYHAGAYSYSESPRKKKPESIRDLQQMQSDLKADFASQYQLGDVFYINASGPAYHLFEKGIIGQPVLKPTLQSVMATYKAVAEAAYARRAY